MGSNLLWLWNPNTGEWEKSPGAVITKHMDALGQVIAGSHKLYWISCNPSAGNSVWELTDDVNGLSALVLDHFHTEKDSHNTNLLPPMQFVNGIYLKTFTAMTSMTFGYI